MAENKKIKLAELVSSNSAIIAAIINRGCYMNILLRVTAKLLELAYRQIYKQHRLFELSGLSVLLYWCRAFVEKNKPLREVNTTSLVDLRVACYKPCNHNAPVYDKSICYLCTVSAFRDDAIKEGSYAK